MRFLTLPALVLVFAFGFAPSDAAQPVPYRAATPVHVLFTAQPEPGLEAKVDLRPQIRHRGLHIRDQGNRGTCTVFATTFLIEYQESGTIGTPPGLKLSEEYLNWAGNQLAGQPYQDGGFFTRFMPAFAAYGIATAKQMPYQAAFDPSNPDAPSATVISSAEAAFPVKYPFTVLKVWDNTKGYTKAELDNVMATVQSGRPVATGMWWLTNFATVTVHGVPLLQYYPRSANVNPATAKLADGHSIDLVGYRESSKFPGGGYFIFRNSFGPGFGDHGYGFVSFQYLLTYGNDAIAIAPQPWHPIKNLPKY